MGNLQWPSICIIKDEEDGDFEDVTAEKISNSMKIINPQIEEAQRPLNKRNT